MELFYRYRRYLPHWRALGATYFVTFRVHRNQPFLSTSERTTVMGVLRRFHGVRYALGPHVVMDDHVHALLTPAVGRPLTRTVAEWKGFSSNAICKQADRTAPLWQPSYFDRIVRNAKEHTAIAEYILSNPWKRWPHLDAYRWVGLDGTNDPGDRGGSVL